jgi:DNA-binding transcriptional LysR family regulator
VSELDRLIRFAAVAEDLSFSQAAKRLNVDQPWLSRQVQQLEAHLGFPLFVRSTRKVTLTAEGEVLFQTARALADAAADCRRASREMTRAYNSTLAVGVSPFSYWVPERKLIMDGFASRHAQVKVELVSNYTSRLLSKLRKRLIDVALIGQPFDHPDLEVMVIHASPISLLVPAEDALAQHARVPLGALAGRRIPVVNPRLNAAHFDILYGPIIAAGAEAVIVPEGEPALPHLAFNERLPVICVGWPNNVPGVLAGFVPVALEPPVPIERFALVRRKEPARGLLEHFWTSALQVVAAQNAEAQNAETQTVEDDAAPRAPRRRPQTHPDAPAEIAMALALDR